MTKEKYETPDMKIVMFDNDDVITTSNEIMPTISPGKDEVDIF